MKRTLLKSVAACTLLVGQCLIVSQSIVGTVQADVQSRIVGGLSVNISTFPSTVAILLNKNLNKDDPFFASQTCGGTLVGPTWVLTAAHCLFDKERNPLIPSDISILAGTTDLTAPVTSATPVSAIYVHPGYKNVLFGDDIALLKLSEPAPAPAIEMNDVQLPANQGVFIAGWGTLVNLKSDGSGARFPNILQGAIVPTQSASACATLPGDYKFVDANSQICAGYAAGGIDSCQGDSGGPLYSETKDGALRLAGITSWGDGCALANQPGIYTDVVAYKNWINETVYSTGDGGSASVIFLPLLLLLYRCRRAGFKLLS